MDYCCYRCGTEEGTLVSIIWPGGSPDHRTLLSCCSLDCIHTAIDMGYVSAIPLMYEYIACADPGKRMRYKPLSPTGWIFP